MEATLQAKIKRGVKISLGLSITITILILVFTIERDTLLALKDIRPSILFLLILVWISHSLLDGLRLRILTKTGERPLTLKRSIEIILSGTFMASVTPFQTGGFPVQLYLFKKEGINPGKAMAYLLFRGLLIYLPLYLAAPFFAISFGLFIELKNSLFGTLFTYLFIILSIALAFLLYSLFAPTKTERILLNLEKRSQGKRRAVLDFLIEELEEFRLGLSIFLKNHNLKYLGQAILVSIVAILVYSVEAPLILYALGLKENLLLAALVQVFLMAILLFIPTPGATGVAELTGAALFALVCPKHLLGILIILWRFFTFYLSAIVGSGIALKKLAQGG